MIAIGHVCMWEVSMPAIVAIPQVVEELLVQFGDYFPNEPSLRHFAEYITGLLVTEHKTVSGIAREFAAPPDEPNVKIRFSGI
jgi:hypothetical protein